MLCNKCRAEKDSAEFHRNRSNPGGFHYVCKVCRKEDNRIEKRIARYHVDAVGYEELLATQENRCAICRGGFPGRGPSVDHDHQCCPTRPTCGECTRGLLCNTCNIKLGVLENLGAEWVTAAKVYLDRHDIL